MNKKSNILLIIAGACVAAGVLLCALSAVLIIFLPTQWNVDDYRTVNHTVTEPFTSIRIEGKSDSDVKFVPAKEGQQYLVVSYEQENQPHTVCVEDSTLIISRRDERKWYDHITLFSLSSPKITVYLPETKYDSLFIDNDTGDVETETRFIFSDVDIRTDTGDVTLRSQVTGTLSVKTGTGDIDIRSINPHSVTLSATTGDVSLYNADVTEDISITTDTGHQSIHEVRCRNLTAKCTTGGITLGQVQIENALQFEADTGRISIGQAQCAFVNGKTTTGNVICENLIVAGELHINTGTGDVKLTRSDAASLKISTDTGNVEGSLLSEKIFHTETDTGTVRVPKSTSGGLCEVVTDTGYITFTILP